MDNDTHDAFQTLHGILAHLARRQTEQGEMLAQIVQLLTPDRDPDHGRSLEELLAELSHVIQGTATAQAEAIRDLARQVQRLGRP